MKNSNEGFTLIELMIVGGILLVIVSISFMAYQQGVRKQYGLSQQARNLANALQLARMQALDNKTAIKIDPPPAVGAQSIDQLGTWYTKIRFSAPNHGVKEGDYVAVAGLVLEASTSTTETPTTGAYYVSSVTSNTFDCIYYHSDTFKATANTVARNLTRSAQLIIMKKSYVDTLPKSTNRNADQQGAIYRSGQHFVYDDKNYRIWDLPDEGNATTETPIYAPTPGFTARGFSASESGYELRLANLPLKPQDFKIITITPFGQVMLGTTR